MNKSAIVTRVENIVCDAVNMSFASLRPDLKAGILIDDIFAKKFCTASIAARFFTFRTLHDIYGFSYKELTILSNIKMRRVMRAVKITREQIFFDPLYMQIKKEIDKRITQGIV